jgi:dual specificity tyrosine-phosphorylation-regulated kinase 2/3/4
MPPPSAFTGPSSLTKETPTKIPRITGRSSATSSPTMKGSVSTTANRRISVNAATLAAANAAVDQSPSPSLTATNETVLNEFGVLETESEAPIKPVATPNHRLSVRASPSTLTASSRVPRQTSQSSTVSTSTRKNRESLSFSGLPKTSTGSVTSLASAAPSESQHHHRFSALSPSKGLKLLSPKISRVSARSTNAATSAAAAAAASSSRQSLSTPSPVPMVDEDEVVGDEEMLHYIRRQQQKKLANGASQEELDEMLRFPEPLPPAPAQKPQGEDLRARKKS